jgi:hypothetical protein
VNSPKNYLIALLALTTIGGAVLSWQQYAELVELRAATMNKDERADLQKRVWDLEKLNKQLRDQLAANRPPRPGGDDPLAADSDGPPDRRDRGSRGGPGGPGGNPLQQLTALRDLLNKPDVQALMSVQQKAAVDARYAALFKSLNLTPEQAEKLKTVLAERQTTMMDVMSAARDQGLDPRRDRDAYQKLMQSAQADVNASIKAVIGDSGFAQFENYEKTLPQRNVVNQLQQRLSYSDTPLTSAQADQLVQILAANTPAPTPGSPGLPGGDGRGPMPFPGGPGPGPGGGRGGPDLGALGAMIGGALGGGPPGGPGPGGGFMAIAGGDAGRGGNATAPITPTAVSQAQAVLAAPQVAALQQLQQQQQSQQQLAKIVAETMAAQNPANGTAAPRPPGGTPPPPNQTKRPGG